MGGIGYGAGESPAEILAAVTDLKSALDADLRSASGKIAVWRRATIWYERTKGTGDLNMDETSNFVDAVGACLNFDGHRTRAACLLATAMLSRLYAEEKSGAEYRNACSAAIAAAGLLERAATENRVVRGKIEVRLPENISSEITEALSYAHKCKSEIGFWWRFRW
jgi:hypothetical protein